jgi:hypothetical protein
MDTEDLDPMARLMVASEIADARLSVAEELSWPLACLAGLSAHLAFDSWLLTLPIVIAAYYFCTFKYRRESSIAEDSYYKAAGLGKYYRPASRQ